MQKIYIVICGKYGKMRNKILKYHKLLIEYMPYNAKRFLYYTN